MSAAEAARRPRILPPIYFFAAVALMVALDRFAPVMVLIAPPWTHIGWALVVLGLVVVLLAKRQFDRAGTTIKPFETSSALVTTGVFAHTRNPMYLSMMLGLLGIFVVLGSLTPLAVIPLFFLIIRMRFVAAEERMLEETFGDAYRNYTRRVRRWL